MTYKGESISDEAIFDLSPEEMDAIAVWDRINT